MPADLDARARRTEREERAVWEEKYAKKKEENEQLREKLSRVLKHLKLLETTLATQQQVLDRYQRELAAYRGGIVPRDAKKVAPDNKRPSAANISSDTEEKPPVKRAKREGEAQRLSLLLTDNPTPDESGGHSSPSRRRSLPETNRRPSARGVREENAGASDVWTARKHDMDSRRAAPIKATDVLRPRQSVRPFSSLSSRHGNACYSGKKSTASDSTDEFLNDHDTAGSVDQKTSAVKSEPKRDERSPLQERSAHEQTVQRRYQRRELPFKSHISVAKMEQHPHEKENVFAYVEVVRNREERAAMPGHDCVECRKYYAALGGLVSEDEMKDRCSRHRARFEPYQTPDDFWRLSFPDSHAEASP
jgi:hypothetical protein